MTVFMFGLTFFLILITSSNSQKTEHLSKRVDKLEKIEETQQYFHDDRLRYQKK